MPTPHLRGDSSLAFLSDGYRFGQRRFERLGADSFSTRLMTRPVTFIRGQQAARFFYEGDRFTRERAMPASVLHLLQDEGSVQTLTGGAHRVRKSMFVDMMTPDAMIRLAEVFRAVWGAAVWEWAERDAIVLHREVARVLTQTACAWAGVVLDPGEVDRRTGEFVAMVDRAGAFGPPNWAARALRLRTEAWARGAVVDARAGAAAAGAREGPRTPIERIVAHRDASGRLLAEQVAATELLNVLRPVVAVGRFIVFTALALRLRPDWAAQFAAGEETGIAAFVQEVRRLSPFFPAVGGRAAGELHWEGRTLARGDWVVLDLFATNRHPQLWERPEVFDPERFAAPADPNSLVPQGGGTLLDGHRCPGEAATIDLMVEAVRLLTQAMEYRVPAQDLRVSLRRMPALPQSGLVLSEVRVRAA